MAEQALIESTEEQEKNFTSTNDLRFPKDSKWAWIVCACSFLTQVLILGILHAFGVFFVEFVRDFETSKGSAAWVGSVAYGLSMAVGPFVSMMVGRFGHRPVMMFGGFLCAVSVLVSSFVTTISALFFTFSVLFGIGTGCAITPTMTVGQEYFDKHASISVGIMTAGSSTGTLITAPLAQGLIRSFGWRNTFRFFAGTCALTVLFNILIRPISVRQKTPSERIQQSPARRLMEELKLWKNRVFVVWTVGITCVMFGYYIPYVHLVSYAVDNGISEEQGSMLVMILGAITATGRVVFGKVVQYGLLNRLHMHQLSMVITGAGTMLLPLITSFWGLAVYVIIIGIVDGCYVVLLPLITCSLVGHDQAVLAWGFLIGACSITFTLGPPVAGFMYDAFGSYNIAFHVAGIPVLAGALILFLIPWAQRTSGSKAIIKVISAVQVHDSEDTSNVDFITLSKCNSVADSNDSQPLHVVSSGDVHVNDLYFSDINQETVVARSPGSRRPLREVDFALTALHKSDQVLSKMLAGGKTSAGQRCDIPRSKETFQTSSASAGKGGSQRKSNVIDISKSNNSPSNRRTNSKSESQSDRNEEKSYDDVGVQADLISVDSQLTSPHLGQSGARANVTFDPLHPSASALYQAILVLEQQQQNAAHQMSESRSSQASGASNQPATPLLEEFVTAQLERLRESLMTSSSNMSSLDNVRQHGSYGIQNGSCAMSNGSFGLSGEVLDPSRSNPSGVSPRTSRGSNNSKSPAFPTHSEGTQTRHSGIDAQGESSIQSPSQQVPATSNISSSRQEAARTGSTPVDIPSTPVQTEDLDVFLMDPLSPFGSPPQEIPRIPPPPLPPQHLPLKLSDNEANTNVPTQPSRNLLGNMESGCIFPMDSSPQAEHVGDSACLPQHDTTLFPDIPPRENVSSKTLSTDTGSVLRMDEDHFSQSPRLQACAASPVRSFDTSPGADSGSDSVKTGRFTVDTVSWPTDSDAQIPTIPPPPPRSLAVDTSHPMDLLTHVELNQQTQGDQEYVDVRDDLRYFEDRSQQIDQDMDHGGTGGAVGGQAEENLFAQEEDVFSLDPLGSLELQDDQQTDDFDDTSDRDGVNLQRNRGSGGFPFDDKT